MSKAYMVFRAVAPPSTQMKNYNEPVRYDPVTVVEGDDDATGADAVNAVIASTGAVSLGFAVCEVELIGFQSQQKLSKTGGLTLKKKPEHKELSETNGLTEDKRRDYEAKIKALEDDIDRLNEM